MKRNKFNLSHYKLGSCDMGKLYPISCFEALPGDTIQMHSSVFLRFAPMMAPVMHPVRVSLYTFAVPLRLLWDDFESFRTGGEDGLDASVPPTYSVSNVDGVQAGSLVDYLGVPVGYKGKFSAFPYRAYTFIYNEYFRDQDLIEPFPSGLDKSGGNQVLTDPDSNQIANVSWEKDYFTTARPWPQKGPTVTVPVDVGSGTITLSPNGMPTFKLVNNSDSSLSADLGSLGYNQVGDGGSTIIPPEGPTFYNVRNNNSSINGVLDPEYNGSQWGRIEFKNPGLKGSLSGLSESTSVHLDNLREAFALQRFEEHRAMYGSRYTEYLRYLGIRARDSRLQRPEYLGGGKSTIQFSEVLQTAADGDNPVGTLRGHGIGLNRGRTFRRFIDEDSIIMTLMTIRPVAIYMNGLPKMFSRRFKEDYWTRELEHIGQQEILTKELFATGDTSSSVNDDTVFGYNNRYDEYRSVPSSVCGEMRNLLDYWHMARSFENAPVLNKDFINGSPTKRIFAEQTMNEIYFMAEHSVVARRILSKMGNPIL